MRHVVVVLVAFAVTMGVANARAADFTARPSSYAAEAAQ
jgi:hypothetical protein